MNILQTQRLTLRCLTPEDADELYSVFSDSKATQFYRAPSSLSQTQDWIRKYLQSYEQYNFGKWAIINKQTDQFVGTGGLSYQQDVAAGRDEIELGYLLKPAFWYKGIATEVGQGVIQYAKTLNIHRLVSIMHPDNLGARKVSEKLGFSFERDIIRWGEPCAMYALEDF